MYPHVTRYSDRRMVRSDHSGYAMTGQLDKADGLYATAVSTFEAAIRDLPSMKENYAQQL